MKSFVMWKLPVLVVGFGAALIFSPACKAQSEVSPDHFDGTDPWEIATKAPAPKTNHKAAPVQARTSKPDSGAIVQLAAARDLSTPSPQDAVAVQDKRKTVARKPKKQ